MFSPFYLNERIKKHGVHCKTVDLAYLLSTVVLHLRISLLLFFCCRMINAVAHNYLYSVKTEDLTESLPTIQDIQQSYNKFKQFFLIGESQNNLSQESLYSYKK